MLVQPVLLLLPAKNLPVTIVCFVLVGAIMGASVFLPQAMIADLKDTDHVDGGSKTGIVVALLQSTSKLAAALAVAVTFVLLPMTGFDPALGVANSTESLMALRQVIVGAPFVFFFLAWLSLRGYVADKVVPEFSEAIDRG
jgi:Na+/melibiose symporter-like transporter